MDVARDTFVNSLAKFTTLGSLKEMKQKNIECIRALLNIAIVDGEGLGESWSPVLQCLSQLAKLQLYANGLVGDDELFEGLDAPEERSSDMTRESRGSISLFASGGSVSSVSASVARLSKKKMEAKLVEELKGRAVLEQIEEELIDKVFANSVKLSVGGIEHFITQLVQVSASEVHCGQAAAANVFSSPQAASGGGAAEGGARIFALQRLVEVADFNMNERPRIVWARIWEQMARHFAVVGCASNSMVSMYAIDSLRQLSSKFLEKPELKDFNFQRVFLRPFQVIMESENSREDVRELILRCIDNLIRALAKNIRSGWKTIFSILSLSARDNKVSIAKLGLEILHRLFDEHLELLCVEVEDFVGLCKTSLSFVCATRENSRQTYSLRERGSSAEGGEFGGQGGLPEGLSMRALCYVACCADAIASGRVKNSSGGHQHGSEDFVTYKNLTDGDAEMMVLWRPLFDGLAYGSVYAGGKSLIVQRACVCTLRAILLRHGGLFNTEQLKAILEQSLEGVWKEGGRADDGEVAALVSESPLDKAVDSALRSAPRGIVSAPDDPELIRLGKVAQSEGTSCVRDIGVAECLVEVMLLNLRRGGEGDAVERKQLGAQQEEYEEDDLILTESWIANTAPAAFGIVVDVCANACAAAAANGGGDGESRCADELLPIVVRILTSSEFFIDKNEENPGGERWHAGESLLRVGLKELLRLPTMMSGNLWWKGSVSWLTFITKQLVGQAQLLVTKITEGSELILQKEAAIKASLNARVDQNVLRAGVEDMRWVDTVYGRGEILAEGDFGSTTIVKLDWGATLYAADSEGTIMREERHTGDVRWNALSDDEGDEDGTAGESYLDESLEVIEGGPLRKFVEPLCGRLGMLSATIAGVSGLAGGMVEHCGEEDWRAVLSVLQDAAVGVQMSDGLRGPLAMCSYGENWVREESLKRCSGGEGLVIEVAAVAHQAQARVLTLLYDRDGGGNDAWVADLVGTMVVERLEEYLVKDEMRLMPTLAGEQKAALDWFVRVGREVVLELLRGMQGWDEKRRAAWKGKLYGSLCNLVVVEDKEVRRELSKVLNLF
jgi:hypothetical protein